MERRPAVERSSGQPWILSAKHDPVYPFDVLALYDQILKLASMSVRRPWSHQVLRALDEHVIPAAGDTIEIHAGADYLDYGLVQGLGDRGSVVEIPSAGMAIGEKLRFYKRGRCPVTDHRDQLDALYVVVARLEDSCGAKRCLAACDSAAGWRAPGVSFFFEEQRRSRVCVSARMRSDRRARHCGGASLSTTATSEEFTAVPPCACTLAQLWALAGNWLGSISASWGVRSTAPTAGRVKEFAIEQAVSAYIGAMQLLCVAVEDAPGPKSDRGVIEAGTIALLSNYDRPSVDPPSGRWLGRDVPRERVSSSGLWNVNHVRQHGNPRALEVLAKRVAKSCAGVRTRRPLHSGS